MAVVFASHRRDGTNGLIEKAIINANTVHDYDFIRMADNRIESCIACYACAKTGECALPSNDRDQFREVFDRLKKADAILIITPVYALIPSRLTALFERLTSVLYASGLMGKPENPLFGKKVAIVNYCSDGICDETELKIIFQKFVMSGYSFTEVKYHYLNNVLKPNEKYGDVCEYVRDIVVNLHE
ncbi:MAG TPA: flavodoxin family protein [Bacillota bacterium]|nr:flavodoxin family protein [Bacillota bacterium]